ncbi:hypothetical protein BD413DRAFT_583560 [Trametes elegans]|nr:hypothetical protein BD413DRAFT_583560 [Trametes elegans]
MRATDGVSQVDRSVIDRYHPVLHRPEYMQPPSDVISSLYSELTTVFGTYLLGTFFSLPLYGSSLYQLFRYFKLYPQDAVFIRLIVILLMLLETLHSVMLMHTCYTFLVTDYSNPLALTEHVWSITLVPAVPSLIALVAQLFFARRVSMLGTMHKVFAASSIILLIGHVGFGIGIMVELQTFKYTSSFNFGTGYWIFPACVGCAAFADSLLSSAIVRGVFRSRRALPRQSEEARVDVIVLYGLNSGILVGLLNVADFILTILGPSNSGYWIAINAVACKLYAITLLSVLNSRKLLISRGIEVLDGMSPGRNIIARANQLAAAERWNVPRVPEGDMGPIRVTVSAETETDHGRLYGGCGGNFEGKHAFV